MRADDSFLFFFFSADDDDFLFFFWAGSSSPAAEVLGVFKSASSRSDDPERRQRFLEATGGSALLVKSPEVDVPGWNRRRSTKVEVFDSTLVLEPSNERFLEARFCPPAAAEGLPLPLAVVASGWVVAAVAVAVAVLDFFVLAEDFLLESFVSLEAGATSPSSPEAVGPNFDGSELVLDTAAGSAVSEVADPLELLDEAAATLLPLIVFLFPPLGGAGVAEAEARTTWAESC